MTLDLFLKLSYIWNWIKTRLGERTSWDGIVLIVAGGTYLLLEPLAQIVAYAAIVYGGWTFWKKQRNNE